MKKFNVIWDSKIYEASFFLYQLDIMNMLILTKCKVWKSSNPGQQI